jgi:hypothetical protein
MAVKAESAITVGTAVNVDGTRMVAITLGEQSAVIPSDAARMYSGMLDRLAAYVEDKNAAGSDGLGEKCAPDPEPEMVWEWDQAAIEAFIEDLKQPPKKKKRKKHKVADAGHADQNA